METILFTYHSREYSGYIVSDTNRLPYHHWFYLNDNTLVRQVGEYISFVENEYGKPRATEIFSTSGNELLDIITEAVEEYLVDKPHPIA
jgi:hypothetical protein